MIVNFAGIWDVFIPLFKKQFVLQKACKTFVKVIVSVNFNKKVICGCFIKCSNTLKMIVNSAKYIQVEPLL